jgi:hypothetical protein
LKTGITTDTRTIASQRSIDYLRPRRTLTGVARIVVVT